MSHKTELDRDRAVHTLPDPLPLFLEEEFDENGLFPIVTHRGAESAACVGYSKTIDTGRLFAASPALLKSLSAAVTFIENAEALLEFWEGPEFDLAGANELLEALKGVV